MEYVGGGSVKDAVKRCGGSLKEVFIAIILREVLLGVDFLHS
jgi:serine/threonine protein kinase